MFVCLKMRPRTFYFQKYPEAPLGRGRPILGLSPAQMLGPLHKKGRLKMRDQ